MSSTNTIINPKPCNYNCGVRIYWSVADNSYLEVFTKQKHICKNKSNNNNVSYSKSHVSNTTKPSYYKTRFGNKEPKPKMSNSLELLTDPISEVQKKYEILSDVVNEFNGKVHGSQSHIVVNDLLRLVVYYEIPEDKREDVKTRFKNSILF